VVKVKICGITNLEDAKLAIAAGCNALGFIFYKKSPRYIRPAKAKDIVKRLPKKIIKVGVFVNDKEKAIKDIAKLCRLDILQFHGNESADFCLRFKGRKIIKAFRVKDKINLAEVISYKTFGYLFDTFVKSKIGGSGKRFKWKLLKKIDRLKRPVFLSGGLSEKNVRAAIRIVRPDWVDVSSAVEIRPGRKDPGKVARFIDIVKNT